MFAQSQVRSESRGTQEKLQAEVLCALQGAARFDSRIRTAKIYVGVTLERCNWRNTTHRTCLMIKLQYLRERMPRVNLRYKSLQRPTIKFSIVGILKLSDVVEKTFMKTNGTYLDAQPTLLNFMRFTYGGGLREADVTYLVTGMDMSQFYQGKVYSQLAGLAYVATLCSYDGVAIGEDRGAVYSGVDIMAHELAHSLESTVYWASCMVNIRHVDLAQQKLRTEKNSSNLLCLFLLR
ncbi:hypothetical protein V5799_015536 [Amblyomma americanum]|uniref:Uncharacterized protein n=1 Tax=Amblyomma americanum TaxID=6943 RepID=A0AAQ4F8Z8_AMBAM